MKPTRVRSQEAFASGQPRHPRRRQQPGPRLRRRRRPAAVHRPRRGAVSLRHRRQPLPRLHRLLGPADPGPRPSARGRRPSMEAMRRGASFGAPTEAESQLAELIIDAVPSIEMVRMVSSGTEAAMSAIRLARGFTGRDVIVKFAGCYHGHVDSLLVAGRLQRHDARRAQQPRRARGLHRRHARAALQRRRRAWPTPSPPTATRSPASSSSRSSATWAWSRRTPSS